MKNIFLGIVALFITIYLLCTGLNIYSIQTKKMELEDELSRAVFHALEENYLVGNEEKARKELEQEISVSEIRIQALDLEKGLIQVLVSADVPLVTGGVKQIVIEKTAIMERMDTSSEKVFVTFMVDGEIYKEYQLTKGETCPMPKIPGEMFEGWIEYGAESIEPVESIGEVWMDKVYIAITE